MEKLLTMLHGSHNDNSKEHAEGALEFWQATPLSQDSEDDQNKVENPFDDSGIGEYNAGDDELSIDGNRSNFWLTVTGSDDAFWTTYNSFHCSTGDDDDDVVGDDDDDDNTVLNDQDSDTISDETDNCPTVPIPIRQIPITME